MKFQHRESSIIYTIESNPNDIVFDVKKKLSDKTNIPIDRIRLIYKNRTLDNYLISDYNIGQNEIVLFDYDESNNLSHFLSDFWRIPIKVFLENYTGIGDYLVYCGVDPDKKIECLRRQARERGFGGDSVENSVFFLGKSILSIDKSFRSYGINHGDRIVMARDRNRIDERTSFTVRVIDYVTNKNGDRFTVEIKPSGTVEELRKVILSRLGLEEDINCVIDLCYGDRVLWNDDRTMIDCGVEEGVTVEITERKLCLVPLNIKCEPIECRVDKSSIIDTAIDIILNRLNIDKPFKSSIKLFKDPYITRDQIKIDFDIFDSLRKVSWDRRTGYKIYYFIEPIVGNLFRNKVISRGAFGTVYLCTDTDSNTQKALKKFDLISNSNKERSDLIREISVYEKLGDHPRIIKYETHFETETALFMQMEYMPGDSLTSYLRTSGPLSEEKISKYAKQICEGLKHLHDNKIFHRDINGEHILIDSNDNIKLSGFGLSKIFMELESRNSQVGTINYKAPEVINENRFGSAADIWSFGATIVEMVTGHPLFHGMNDYQVLYILSTKKAINFLYPPNSSDQIKSFIDRCLQVDPHQRSTVDELLSQPLL